MIQNSNLFYIYLSTPRLSYIFGSKYSPAQFPQHWMQNIYLSVKIDNVERKERR